MDRLTDDSFYPETEGCKDCPDYGEPNGCNRADGPCDAYDLFVSIYEKLREYEDTGLTPDEIVAMREELAKAKQQIADNAVFMAAHGAGGYVFDTRADQVPTEDTASTTATIAPVADIPATGNRVLTLDEVLALPDGARVWVELSRKSYFNSEMHTFSAAENRSIAEIREPRLTDMSGRWFPINADWVNDEYRVWSLPVAPTPEELERWPWEEGKAQ